VARLGGIGARGQVNAVGAAGFRQSGIAVYRQTRTVSPRDRQQHRSKRDLIIVGEILLPHAHPPAAGGKRRAYHIRKGQAGLMSVGDDEQRRIGEVVHCAFIAPRHLLRQ
jgi:hypothetical protein